MPTAYTNRSTLNFDSPEPTVTAGPNASALFPSQPVYARTPKKKASSNLPLMVGAPVLALVAGGLVWMAMGGQAEAPTDPKSLQVAAVESQPTPSALPTEPRATPVPAPTELTANDAVTPASAPVARTVTPRASAPTRAPARSVATASVRTSAPDISAAASNVSATVATPTPTVGTPTIAEPPPLVIPAPAAQQPAPQEQETPM